MWDYNDHRANTDLGCATFDLKGLQQDATQENLELPVLKDGKERGTLRFDVNFFPVLKPEVDAGGVETVPDTSKLFMTTCMGLNSPRRHHLQRSGLSDSLYIKLRTSTLLSP